MLRLIPIVITMLLFFLGLSTVDCADPKPLPEVRIGLLNELTGPVASLGEIYLRGVQIALKTKVTDGKIKGVPVAILYGDARDDAKVAMSEFLRLSDVEKIDVVLSPRSKTAMPINPAAEKRGIPVVGTVGAPKFLSTNRYAVRAMVSAGADGAFEADVASRLGKKRAAVIGVEDEWVNGLMDAIAANFSFPGAELVYRASIMPEDRDFGTYAARIRASRPDVVFVQLLTNSGSFVRKLRESGVDAQLITSYWIQQPEQVLAAGKEALEDLAFVEFDSGVPLFRAAYEKSFPGSPFNSAAYLGYVAMSTAIEAISSEGALLSHEALRSAFVALKKIHLIDGELDVRDRQVLFNMVARRFKDGLVQNL